MHGNCIRCGRPLDEFDSEGLCYPCEVYLVNKIIDAQQLGKAAKEEQEEAARKRAIEKKKAILSNLRKYSPIKIKITR
jgi:hypothetical protein